MGKIPTAIGLATAATLAACSASPRPVPAPAPAAAATSVEAPPAPIAPDSLADALLVDVGSVDSTIRIDVRYATANNFTGAPLPGYDAARILLRREAAEALARVQRRLASGGLGLRVFDGYRPVRATLAMVDWAERSGRRALLDSGYIARRSRHNMGVAVDLTLVDLVTGTEVPMGTAFDTFSEAAHTANAEGRERRYRELLVTVMEAEGRELRPGMVAFQLSGGRRCAVRPRSWGGREWLPPTIVLHATTIGCPWFVSAREAWNAVGRAACWDAGSISFLDRHHQPSWIATLDPSALRRE